MIGVSHLNWIGPYNISAFIGVISRSHWNGVFIGGFWAAFIARTWEIVPRFFWWIRSGCAFLAFNRALGCLPSLNQVFHSNFHVKDFYTYSFSCFNMTDNKDKILAEKIKNELLYDEEGTTTLITYSFGFLIWYPSDLYNIFWKRMIKINWDRNSANWSK